MSSSSLPAAKPVASLSVDLDNQWSYMKTHGDAGWETFPSYLDVVVPRVLDFMKARDLIITFFIVGQDAALEKNSEALGAVSAAGHEIGNHSFHHEPWLHTHSEQEIEQELTLASEQIERVTGENPIGFRGPGYSFSQGILRVLVRLGYQYDASTFPTYLGPLARAYYFMTTRMSEEERLQRKDLFGGLRDGLRPLKPYRCELDAGTMIEIPVTTMPIFKLPIHVSYILYLSSFSPFLALSYFRNAIRFCRLTGTPVSLLLHPLDFLGADDLQEVSFFPGMGMSSERKLQTVSDVLSIMLANFSVGPLRRHATSLSQDKLKHVLADSKGRI